MIRLFEYNSYDENNIQFGGMSHEIMSLDNSLSRPGKRMPAPKPFKFMPGDKVKAHLNNGDDIYGQINSIVFNDDKQAFAYVLDYYTNTIIKCDINLLHKTK